jgi:uncharacterized protein YndB with AHSA1/START domain
MTHALALVTLHFLVAADADYGRLVTEGVINAPVADVWAAFTTKAGLESWMVAHTDIELKVGGRWRTHYDPKGMLGDAGGIEHTILALDPKRMIAFRTVKPPEKFPFKKALEAMWTVVYFEDAGQGRTRITTACLGFTDDEDSQKMRKFFEAGNDITVKRLQKRFEKGKE